jgi:opacity protein-like surface antigen
MTKTTTMRARAGISCGLMTAVAIIPSAHADLAATNSPTTVVPRPLWQKPVWLTDLSFGVRESYDDNILLVSGKGLQPQESWITSFSPKLGFNFAPVLGPDSNFQALTLVYAPDINIYHEAPQESYDAQRFFNFVKIAEDNFTFSLTNSFLYNNGSRTAPTYALNQASNTNDRFRNFFAFAAPRERADQIQDRGTASMQYDTGNTFVRPTVSTIYYNLNTVFHNAGTAPYIGYQNWPDRYDVNGGADWGYRLAPSLAVTAGYRYGYQFQAQFPENISPGDRHYSSNHYQRALIGLEGNLTSWLNIKAAGGPDFREFNSMAAVSHDYSVFPFAEATATATITPGQALVFYTKEWEWVSSAGLVPYYDSTYSLTYHWSATHQLGLDLGGKILNADFRHSNDTAGIEPGRRDDLEYAITTGATYAFTQNFNANLTYNFNLGRSLLENVPESGYRDFEDDLVSLGVQYKF